MPPPFPDSQKNVETKFSKFSQNHYDQVHFSPFEIKFRLHKNWLHRCFRIKLPQWKLWVGIEPTVSYTINKIILPYFLDETDFCKISSYLISAQDTKLYIRNIRQQVETHVVVAWIDSRIYPNFWKRGDSLIPCTWIRPMLWSVRLIKEEPGSSLVLAP